MGTAPAHKRGAEIGAADDFGFWPDTRLRLCRIADEIGLPPENVASALIGFNIGIEIGQLLVFVPLVVLGPYLLEELPTPPIKWADIAALVLTFSASFCCFARPYLAHLPPFLL